ncbi:MAG TPA: hypothetical protein VMU22_00220 [Rhizomicrobium sp.]|nr:hypothetical protein [Rhizomicrobium sp.]
MDKFFIQLVSLARRSDNPNQLRLRLLFAPMDVRNAAEWQEQD